VGPGHQLVVGLSLELTAVGAQPGSTARLRGADNSVHAYIAATYQLWSKV
jgi:hypothetical protein